VTLGISVPARAQWIVYDPANTVQSVINTAQEIAKFVQMINNQVQQIQTLTDQLNEFKHYESLFAIPRRSCSPRSSRL
jgi:P-type conjugative transfer protein TrbJ